MLEVGVEEVLNELDVLGSGVEGVLGDAVGLLKPKRRASQELAVEEEGAVAEELDDDDAAVVSVAGADRVVGVVVVALTMPVSVALCGISTCF